MAKRRKRALKRVQRDTTIISKKRVLLRPPFKIKRRRLYEVEDRRRWRPNWIEPRLISGRSARVAATSVSKGTGKPIRLQFSKVGFVNPERTIICRRRAQRREALFKRKKVGKGVSSRRFKRRIISDTSKVRC